MKKTRKRSNVRRIIVSALLVLCLLVVFFSWQYRPLMIDSAAKLAQNTANDAINQTVCELLEEEHLAYNELISIAYDDSGAITALSANAARINAVKAKTALAVRERLGKTDSMEIGIPLGTLCASTLFAGVGPPINCRSLLSAIPTVSLQYHFDGAGINQTLHSIIMVVTVPLSVTLPLQSTDIEVKTSFLIGETILVGEVPDAYTNVISDPEVADDIFNYGDVW